MITFDSAKRQINLAKHGVDLVIAEIVLAGTVVTLEDSREAYGETRIQALGLYNGRVMQVVYTPRGDADHIISVRKAERHEATYYWSIHRGR